MSCTIEKILTDAKTLLERLREHDAAAESLVDQSAALHRRVAAMREAGTALPDQVRRRPAGAGYRRARVGGPRPGAGPGLRVEVLGLTLVPGNSGSCPGPADC